MPSLPAAFLDRPIAHRALHDRALGRPENSREAVRAAVAAGYGIEIDLQLSRDGAAMVFHDDHLDRLTEAEGPITARDAAELVELRLRDGASGIPILQDVLSEVGGRVPLLIELKDQSGELGTTDGRLERACAAALEGYDGDAALMSFNPRSVGLLAELAPDRPRGLTTDAFARSDWPDLDAATREHLRAIPDVEATGACFISHDHRDLDAPRVAELKAQGLHILCWTIRSPEEEAAARRVAHNVTFEGYAA